MGIWAKTIAITAMTMLSLACAAQDDPEYRYEIGAGVGMAGYLGDYNGSLARGMQPAASIVGRYNMNPWMALRLNIGYGKMKGASKNADTWYPTTDQLGYTFNNSLYDLSVVYEYNFMPYGTGRDYRGAKRFTPFLLAGLGLGMCSTTEKTRTAMTLPLGIGVKYKISERLNVGLEWAINFTTSDWLDGVKDPYDIESTGMFKNTDAFHRLQLSLTYSFSPKCLNCNKE
jgi:opacity protein-like surface antigen